MQQNQEATRFLQNISSVSLGTEGAHAKLDGILQLAVDDETEIRRLFATDKQNQRLQDTHVGLVSVFDTGSIDITTACARTINASNDDLHAKFIAPLDEKQRRNNGAPAIVSSIEEFKKNWAIFTEGSLSQLVNWQNVIAAGGSVLACLQPLPEEFKLTKRTMRKFYHSNKYPSSDVDLFLWGLDAEQAESKIQEIYAAVRDSVTWDVTCVRTKHTVSIHSQYPYRSIQIVLRLYSSPAEILAGFDIDAPCCAFDGDYLWANPRAIIANIRQCNTVDVSRRSPSYEVRLTKYAARGFEVYVPFLRREDIDPTIFERSIFRIQGLARLLVLEKLADENMRYSFLSDRRRMRGRPDPLAQYGAGRWKKKYKGDLKGDTGLTGLEMNDYDVGSLHIPYGVGWDARRINKLIYQTDLGMNSTFNPKNKGRRLHRHPAFFGTMEQCLEDCCEHCPEPVDEDERKLQEEEDKNYIRGRIAFIEENPGRQTISGSFNPIDDGEWSGQVYVGDTVKFFSAIAAHDRETVANMLQNDESIDLNQRDHVGRAPLHVAILTKAVDIACDLVDKGARITARLVDGRTSLHLAAQYDLLPVVKKLLEKSKLNTEIAEKDGKLPIKEDDETKTTSLDIRDSSQDDWTSEDNGVVSLDEEFEDSDEGQTEDDDSNSEVSQNKKATDKNALPSAGESGDIPENSDELPDILDIDLPDWDLAFTPLQHAVISGSLPLIDELLAAGADPKLVTKAKSDGSSAFHPLTLTIIADDEDRACAVAERLIQAGATSSTADDKLQTIFHKAVCSQRPKLVSTLLRLDPTPNKILNFPSVDYSNIIFPIISAINSRDYSMVAVLLSHGANIKFTEDDVSRAKSANPKQSNNSYQDNGMEPVYMPVETAVALNDDIFALLVTNLDIDVNLLTRSSLNKWSKQKQTVLDHVQSSIQKLTKEISLAISNDLFARPRSYRIELAEYVTTTGTSPWILHIRTIREQANKHDSQTSEEDRQKNQEARTSKEAIKTYLESVERLLVAHGTKIVELLDYPPAAYDAPNVNNDSFNHIYVVGDGWHSQPTPSHLTPSYHELFEAAFAGENDKIQQLCLPDSANQEPLHVAVQVATSNRHYSSGFTPFFLAISARRWETARLILVISSAQHKEDKPVPFRVDDIELDADSESEGADSDDCESIIEEVKLNFIDIAQRPSPVSSDIGPKEVLEQEIEWFDESLNTKSRVNVLHKAIACNDFEAFTEILGLYANAIPGQPIRLNVTVQNLILQYDRPEMLDFFIRKTGRGLDLIEEDARKDHEVTSEHRHNLVTLNDKDRIYLGLNFNGRKRTDLVAQTDPIDSDENHAPLLWLVLRSRAMNIIEYLLDGVRPVEAYKAYSLSHIDKQAQRLRKLGSNLGEAVSRSLGLRTNLLQESPLTAAILGGGDLELIKLLFAKIPKFLTPIIHNRIHFIGFNPLMLAVNQGCKTEVVDYLLAKRISPAETDQRGWNIFHILASKSNLELLDHLLAKLPRDVVEALLRQQSKGALNTPLHIAVKSSSINIVKRLLKLNPDATSERDAMGSTPLHTSVYAGNPHITNMLIEASSTEILHSENGVGETPTDIANLQDILDRTNQFNSMVSPNIPVLSPNHVPYLANNLPDKMEKTVVKLKSTLSSLLDEGKLVKGTKLADGLAELAETLQKKSETVVGVSMNAVEEKEETVSYDSCDRRAVLSAISAAVMARPSDRKLVHLLDVQQSVQASLARLNSELSDDQHDDDASDAVAEENLEQKEKSRSMVLQTVQHVGIDRWY